jgi:translation initiation factor 2 subunit 1
MVKKLVEPKENELVICVVKDIRENSAWCEILEYQEYKGIISANEVSSSTLNLKEALKVDKQYVAKIIKVDKERKILELSLKKVSEIEEKEKREEFKKEQKAEKILELIGKKYNKSLKEIYEEFGNKILKKYGNLHTFIENFLRNKKLAEEIPKKYREDFERILESLSKKKKVKISYILVAQSFRKKLEEIKEILSKIEKVGEVKYLGAGKYLLTKFSENPKKDEKEILKMIEKIKDEFEIFKYEKVEKV